MLLDRTHRTWAFISAVIMAVATVSYVIYAESTPKGPSGGSLMGLLYGVIGSLMMIYAGLLGGRKQFPFWRLGSAQFWLRGHIWFGTLSFPLILFHAGFGLGGLLEQILMGFFFIVWLSGFFGLAMQHFMPKLLTSRIGRETFAVQVPYLKKRNRILADKLVSADCGKVPLDSDPMKKELERIGKFTAEMIAKGKEAKGKEAKEKVKAEKALWIEKVPQDDVGLYLDLAKHADFPDQIVSIYELPGADSSGDAAKSENGKPGASPLEQMKGKQAASPLEQMKAKQAMSPLEQMKAKVNKSAEGDGKPKSPLEMARQAGPKGGGKAAGGAKLSPLEMARQQGAVGSGGAVAAPAAPAGNLSTIDLIRQQGAFGSGGAKKAALAAAAPAAKAPVKQVAPAPKKSKKPSPTTMMVGSVGDELSAIRKLLTEKYGLDDTLAGSAAEKAREFLKVDPETEVAAVKSVFMEKYGYEESIAVDIAEKVRPFVDGSAEKAAEEKAQKAQAAKAAPASKPDAGSAPAAGGKLSTLDLIRQQGAFGSGGASKGAPAGGGAGKKLSPLEQMQGKAGGGSKPEAAKPAAKKPPAPVKKKVVKRQPVLRTEELRSFYLKTVRPFLVSSGRKGRLADITEASRAFTQMRGTLPVELHPTLESLQAFCEEHRQFAEQIRIRAWLHYWLAIHIPFSIALFVLFIAHVVLALRVVPWDFPIRF